MRRVEILVQLRVCCPFHCELKLLEIDGGPPEIPPRTGLRVLALPVPLGREHDGRKLRLRGFFYDLDQEDAGIPPAEAAEAMAAARQQLFA